MTQSDITMCLTAGGRPDLLEKTLQSLFLAEPQSRFAKIIISNDWGDPATTAMARKICPQATIVDHSWQMGQHITIDEMYSLVDTPLIFHCEDDWGFRPEPFLDRCREALEHFPMATVVTVRDLPYIVEGAKGRSAQLSSGIAIEADPAKQEEWTSFTFNPSVLRKELWVSLGGYKQFNSEREIDVKLRGQDRREVFLMPGNCQHIGEGRHLVDPFFRKGSVLRDGFRVAKFRIMQLAERLFRRT